MLVLLMNTFNGLCCNYVMQIMETEQDIYLIDVRITARVAPLAPYLFSSEIIAMYLCANACTCTNVGRAGGRAYSA